MAGMKDVDRRAQLTTLWLNYASKGEPTETKLLAFHGWLEEHRPELLKQGHGDSYQQLKTDLREHIGQIQGPPETPKKSKREPKKSQRKR
jgi:hypothetical protein